jgi:hypothetical protein
VPRVVRVERPWTRSIACSSGLKVCLVERPDGERSRCLSSPLVVHFWYSIAMKFVQSYYGAYILFWPMDTSGLCLSHITVNSIFYPLLALFYKSCFRFTKSWVYLHLYHYIVHKFLNLDLPLSYTVFPPTHLCSNLTRWFTCWSFQLPFIRLKIIWSNGCELDLGFITGVPARGFRWVVGYFGTSAPSMWHVQPVIWCVASSSRIKCEHFTKSTVSPSPITK